MTGSSFIEKHYIPSSIVPFIELSRLHYFLGPNGVFWPAGWAATIVAKQIQLPLKDYIKLMIAMHVIVGYLLHSLGSTWNDIVDKDFDSRVERTKSRPLPSGRVTVKNALLFLLPQVVFMMGVLSSTDTKSFYLGIFDLLVLVPLYPFMKRITYWPQAWLGITIGWDMFVISAILVNDAQFSLLFPLFFGSVCWCIHYDTVYGMMDRNDDIKIGIKSTALLFGEHARLIMAMFSATFVCCLWITGIMIHASLAYYLVTVFLTSAHLIWQLALVDFDSNTSCARIFFSNVSVVGSLVWGGLFLEYLR